MHPGRHAPDKAAIVMAGSGEIVTYGELDERSIRLARLWRESGLRPGDHVALLAENHPRYFEVYWAAMRSGLYITAINRFLSADEAAYIVDDSGARSLVASAGVGDLAIAVAERTAACDVRLAFGGPVDGFDSYEDGVAGVSAEPLGEQPAGSMMLYSSGTTGRPKGVLRPLPGVDLDAGDAPSVLTLLFGMQPDTVYLSPAPLYHAAPLAFTTGVHALGGTVVVLEHFDPVVALEAIERFEATSSQWVPTMFVRMLKLPEEERLRHDVSSMKIAIHAAAPCPPEVKRQMIGWWGPVLVEYYAGTEGNGITIVTSEEWLAHPGTVGQPKNAVIHICDDLGRELEVGETGTIYFEQPTPAFEYHGDAEKTSGSRHPDHENWSTLGDVGRLDEDGYLYLSDRKAFMIISGGVNIYPQEIEDCLILHPKVADVAVFGLPDEDMGERVQAVVQPAEGVVGDDALEQELLAHARDAIARYKVPRSIHFRPELPRLPTGKLYKRLLRDEYLARVPLP